MGATVNRKRKPWLLLLGPYSPPTGGVVSYLEAVFRQVPAGDCAWYGYGERPHVNETIRAVRLQDFDPASCLWRLFHPRVVLDSSTVFLEYFDSRLLKRWLPSLLLRRSRWVKVVHDTNLPRLFELYDPRTQRLIRLGSRFVWRFVVVNEELGRWLGETLVPPSKVSVIPSLIETPAVSEEPVADSAFERLRAGCDQLICAVGAMNPEYGFQHVAAAVRRLQLETPGRVGLVLLCTGFAAQPGFLDQLKRDCPELLVLSNLPRAQALAVMRDSEVVVRAVRSESYGLSRVEAVCQGTPVVATRTGQTRGMHCYTFGDVEGLVAQLNGALSEGARLATREAADHFSNEAASNRKNLMMLLHRAAQRA